MLKLECWTPSDEEPRVNIGHLSTIPELRLPAFLEDDPVILSTIPDPIGNKRNIIYTLEPSIQDIITPEDNQLPRYKWFIIILTSMLCSVIIIGTIIMLIVYLTKK